jgi:hypothetical protein
MLGNKGIHFGIWPDVPDVEVDTTNGSRVYGDFRIVTFSGLRKFLKPEFVDRFGNNISPARKYKPGRSLFLIAERVKDIVKHDSLDFSYQLDRADEHSDGLEKIIRHLTDLTPKEKEEIAKRVTEEPTVTS